MIRFKVKENVIRFRVLDAVPVSGVVADPYEGAYIITPKLEAQTMATKNKMMKDNVTIEKIPVSIVSNSAGGNTVIIGG